MGIEKDIRLLIETQKLDAKIHSLKKDSEDKPRDLEKFKAEVQVKKENLAKAEGELKSIQVKRKDRELTLQKKEEDIKKYQVQLYQIKSNKEYKSLLTEIEGAKADNSVLEEEIIVILDEIDNTAEAISTEKENLKKEEDNLREAEQRVKNEIAQINGELTNLNEKRSKIVSQIEKTILTKYEHILKNKNSLAMVPVMNGTCRGCQMDVPPQVINEIKMKENLVICENCSRILYIPEQ
ncbi:MAG: C4-type zinc ribbon domain-containing protein [Candidatus Omnitrophota bacterium]|nr:C4-type zinc ribbon domain-containing protein [Candidatus Omnitrophota bacterium]